MKKLITLAAALTVATALFAGEHASGKKSCCGSCKSETAVEKAGSCSQAGKSCATDSACSSKKKAGCPAGGCPAKK